MEEKVNRTMTGKNIVCLAYTTWEGNFVKSQVELLSRLAGDNKILFIEHQFTLVDLYRNWRKNGKLDAKRILGRKNRIRTITTKDGASVYLLTLPPTLPYAFTRSVGLMKRILRFNTRLILPAIRKAIHELKMQDDFILLNSFNPFYGLPINKKLGEKAQIYYCFDAISENRFGNTGLIIEDEYMRQIAGTIVSSDHLYQIKSQSNKDCMVVKNGVNYAVFDNYYKNHSREKLKKVGYIGSIDFRFEAEMIAWVATQMPDYEFEVVGRIANQEAMAILEKVSNVRYRAPVSPDEVPAIMFNCDVGIIPYTRIEENKNVYPLKINEYLAVGTPVVMTDFAHLPEFEEFVSVASTREEFLEMLKKEIESDTSEKQLERNRFAAQNSWDSRTTAFGNAILQLTEK